MADIDTEITEQVRTELLWIARRYAGAAHGKYARQPNVREMRARWELQARRFEQLAAGASQLFAECDLREATTSTTHHAATETEASRVH